MSATTKTRDDDFGPMERVADDFRAVRDRERRAEVGDAPLNHLVL